MAVAALCIRLVVSGIILGHAHGQEGNAFLQVVPNKQHFFEYDPLSLLCKGLHRSSDWTIVHNSNGQPLKCSVTRTPTTLTCTIRNIYEDDAGEYWCEAGAENRTNRVVIIVTGSVILESPPLPVMEGDDVTLRCRGKTTSSSNFKTYFYKDGVVMNASTTGHLMIFSVSKSDEGLYKCSITGAGESAETWLNVTASLSKVGGSVTPPSSVAAAHWIVITIPLAALLIMLGTHHLVKYYWHREPSAVVSSAVVYATVPENRQNKGEYRLSTSMYYTFTATEEDEPGASAAVTNQPPGDDFYSFLQ